MSIFGSILNKIVEIATGGHAQGAAAAKPQTAPSPQNPTQAAAPPKPAPQPVKMEQVDVDKVLSDLAAKKGGGGNWRTSIVDLLKLLDLDSSLAARKELAKELNVHAGADGTAEQNIALQKVVWAKLAENGGKVPASLKD
jgi:hypothetical protein